LHSLNARHVMPRSHHVIALLVPLALLAGCQLMGGEPAEAAAARKEAEGKAIGGACRHAGRAIEDCFALNKRADKAALFAGWREMNDYMRDNKIDAVAPLGGLTAEVVEKAEKTEKAETARKSDEPAAEDSAVKKPAKGKKHDT
jgi:citrate lyase alpha subunit